MTEILSNKYNNRTRKNPKKRQKPVKSQFNIQQLTQVMTRRSHITNYSPLIQQVQFKRALNHRKQLTYRKLMTFRRFQKLKMIQIVHLQPEKLQLTTSVGLNKRTRMKENNCKISMISRSTFKKLSKFSMRPLNSPNKAQVR